jgi:hypothetical protein
MKSSSGNRGQIASGNRQLTEPSMLGFCQIALGVIKASSMAMKKPSVIPDRLLGVASQVDVSHRIFDGGISPIAMIIVSIL